MFCGAPPLSLEECPRFVRAPLSKKCKLCGCKEKLHHAAPPTASGSAPVDLLNSSNASSTLHSTTANESRPAAAGGSSAPRGVNPADPAGASESTTRSALESAPRDGGSRENGVLETKEGEARPSHSSPPKHLTGSADAEPAQLCPPHTAVDTRKPDEEATAASAAAVTQQQEALSRVLDLDVLIGNVPRKSVPNIPAALIEDGLVKAKIGRKHVVPTYAVYDTSESDSGAASDDENTHPVPDHSNVEQKPCQKPTDSPSEPAHVATTHQPLALGDEPQRRAMVGKTRNTTTTHANEGSARNNNNSANTSYHLPQDVNGASRRVMPLGTKRELQPFGPSTSATTFAMAASASTTDCSDASGDESDKKSQERAGTSRLGSLPIHGPAARVKTEAISMATPPHTVRSATASMTSGAGTCSSKTIELDSSPPAPPVATLQQLSSCRKKALREWSKHIADITSSNSRRSSKGTVYVLGQSQVRLMTGICQDMGMKLRNSFDPTSDSIESGDFVLPIKTKDIAMVIRESPAAGVHVARFPNTRKLCGKALMTKLMRRAQTYAPVVRPRSLKTPISRAASSSGKSESMTPTQAGQQIVTPGGRRLLRRRDPSLARLKETFLSFLPRTWIVPADAEVLASEMAAYSRQISKYTGRRVTYIVKPDGGARGDGIFLAHSYQDIEYKRDWMWRNMPGASKEYVVQHYIANPLLLQLDPEAEAVPDADAQTMNPEQNAQQVPRLVTNGVKFDLRLYILVARLSPSPVVYLCKEGLARLCTTLYEAPAEDNMQDSSIHLSNYSLNKKEAGFKRDIHDPSGGMGNKRALSAVLPLMERQGLDVSTFWEKLALIAYRTVVALAPSMSRSTMEGGADFRGCSSGKCFHVFGMDVMLDQDFHPWLLELNSSPSMNTSTAIRVDECDDDEVRSACNECDCSEVEGTHFHVTSAIDDYVKRTVMQGAMEIALGLANGVPVHRYLQLLHCANVPLTAEAKVRHARQGRRDSRHRKNRVGFSFPSDHLLFAEPIEAWITASAPTGGARRTDAPSTSTPAHLRRPSSSSRSSTPTQQMSAPKIRGNSSIKTPSPPEHKRTVSSIVNQDDSDDASVDAADVLDTDAGGSDDDSSDDDSSDQDFVQPTHMTQVRIPGGKPPLPATSRSAMSRGRQRGSNSVRPAQPMLPRNKRLGRAGSENEEESSGDASSDASSVSVLETEDAAIVRAAAAAPSRIDFSFDRSAYRTIYVLQGLRKLWRAVAGKARHINSFKIRAMCKEGELTNNNLTLGEVDGIFRRVRRDGYSKGHQAPGMREFFDLVTLLVAQSVHGVLNTAPHANARNNPRNSRTKASGAAGSGSAIALHRRLSGRRGSSSLSSRIARSSSNDNGKGNGGGSKWNDGGDASGAPEYSIRVIHGLEIPLDGALCPGIEKLIRNYFGGGVPSSPLV